MSSSDQIPSETTLLLDDSSTAGQSSRILRGKCNRFSPVTLLVPVALATSLAVGIQSTTFIELVRQAVCRLWNALHSDPAALTSGTPQVCDAPEVARYFAIALAIIDTSKSVISIAGLGILSRISSHYGRKPAFSLVFLAGITSTCTIAGSQYLPDWLAGWTLLVGMLFGAFCSPLPYIIDMYIVDECAPEDRTSALSKISGWTGLGTCVSFTLGGSMTTRTGNSAIVFHMATTIYTAAFTYVAFFLPESFPEEKRNALYNMRQEHSNGLPATTRPSFLHLLEPLKTLVPARKSDETRNWRLAWCATHNFVFMAAHSYAWPAWLVLATSKHHLTPADTGLFFTVISFSSMIVLMVIVPALVRFLRPYYRRKAIILTEDMSSAGELGSETSDRLHVHLAVASCAISGISLLSATTSTTNLALIFSGICSGFTFIHGPAVHSLVAGSVDPLMQGEALAAVKMVSQAGSILSPMIMGSILTATIETMPLLLFYVHMAIVLISSSFLFLVRDGDRYQKPCDAERIIDQGPLQ